MRNLITVTAGLILFSATSSPADLKAGKTAYEAECQDCHGESGAPNAALAKKLKITLKDLRDPVVTARPDAEWRKQIIAGVGKMKPVKGLSTATVDDVIAYSRTFKK